MSPHPDLPGWMEKHALYLPTNPDQPPALLLDESEGQQGHTKLASLGLLPEVQSFVDGFQGRSGCRYVLVNAMGASEYYGMNANRDAFPEHALVHTPEGWTGGKDPEKDKKLSESCSYGYPTFYRAGVFCFPAGTKVILADRTRAPIESIQVGQQVATPAGPRKVTRLFRRAYSGPGVRLKLRGEFEPLISTNEHPLRVYRRDQVLCKHGYNKTNITGGCDRGCSRDMGEAQWLPAEEVLPGDYLLLPAPLHGDEAVDARFAELTGWVASEGYLGKNGDIQFTFSARNTGDIQSVTSCLRYFGLHVTVTPRPQYGVVHLSACSRELHTRLSRYVAGVYYDKRLTSAILEWDRDSLLRFLGAYIDGDGHVAGSGPNKGQLRIRSSSEPMLRALSDVIRSLGVAATVNWDNPPGVMLSPTNGKVYPARGSGVVAVSTSWSKVLLTYSRKKLKEHPKVKSWRWEPVDGFFLVQVTGREDPWLEEEVFNIEVEDEHTYLAGEVWVHNCHHKNKDHNKRVGNVVFATWNDRMKRVELVLEVEQERAQAHNGAGFWQSLISNQLPAVSMGARVKIDRCSKCTDLTSFYAALKKYDPAKHANPGMAVLEEHMRRRDAAGIPREAKDRVGGIQGIGRTRAEYCDCMRFHAGEVDPLTGLQIFVYNDFPLFFDISLVFVPADKTARGILFLGSGSSSSKTPPTPSIEKRGRLSDMGLVKFAGVAEEVQRYLDPVKPTNTQGATLEGQINLALNGGKQLDGTIRQSSDPMLFVPKDPWSRTNPREDLRHNPSSPNPASQSGRDSGNVTPKIASSPEDKLEALKLARLAKKGEMDKRIEQETPPEELREVARREEDLPKHILDTLGRAPLGAALGSSASLGIVLRPREYQRVALVSMGLPSLADQFDEQRVCFGYQKPSSCPALELLPILAAILAPFLAQRSGFSCLLKDRVVSSLHPRNKASEDSLNKVASLSSELLSTLGASYQGYRAELLNHLAHSQAKLARCQDLELQKVASMQPSELFTPLSFSYFRLAYQDEVAPSTPRTTP